METTPVTLIPRPYWKGPDETPDEVVVSREFYETLKPLRQDRPMNHVIARFAKDGIGYIVQPSSFDNGGGIGVSQHIMEENELAHEMPTEVTFVSAPSRPVISVTFQEVESDGPSVTLLRGIIMEISNVRGVMFVSEGQLRYVRHYKTDSWLLVRVVEVEMSDPAWRHEGFIVATTRATLLPPASAQD
jgi:hypothetical protein